MRKSRLAQFKTYSRRRAVDFVRRGSLQASTELKVILGPQGGARTGRIYKRGKNTHQASAEGESPATDTGRLRQSAAHETIRAEGTKIIGGAGVSTPYALDLELGTENMAARPFIGKLNQDPHRNKIDVAARGAFK